MQGNQLSPAEATNDQADDQLKMFPPNQSVAETPKELTDSQKMIKARMELDSQEQKERIKSARSSALSSRGAAPASIDPASLEGIDDEQNLSEAPQQLPVEPEQAAKAPDDELEKDIQDEQINVDIKSPRAAAEQEEENDEQMR